MSVMFVGTDGKKARFLVSVDNGTHDLIRLVSDAVNEMGGLAPSVAKLFVNERARLDGRIVLMSIQAVNKKDPGDTFSQHAARLAKSGFYKHMEGSAEDFYLSFSSGKMAANASVNINTGILSIESAIGDIGYQATGVTLEVGLSN